MPMMFDCVAESEAVKVKFGDKPEPESGTTESAAGDPPVTVQPPTVTQPELEPLSAAYRYAFLAPKKVALNARSRVITSDVAPAATVVLAPRRVHCWFGPPRMIRGSAAPSHWRDCRRITKSYCACDRTLGCTHWWCPRLERTASLQPEGIRNRPGRTR